MSSILVILGVYLIFVSIEGHWEIYLLNRKHINSINTVQLNNILINPLTIDKLEN